VSPQGPTQSVPKIADPPFPCRDNSNPVLMLAPMEGVVDPVMREILTGIGGVDYCVTEFVRVTNHLFPEKVFLRYAPELAFGSKTLSGTPLFVQLLGGDPIPVAENAARVGEMGAFGIDLNFGCPAKTVNRHDGGATLLKQPERVFKMASAVRKAVPKEKPVTVKVRLGFSCKTFVKEIAQAAESAGATWLTVHARTKEEGYRPPAHWSYVGDMMAASSIPIIANGDIWTREDYKRCVQESGTPHAMLGRGLVARPQLAHEIKGCLSSKTWKHWGPFIQSFMRKSLAYKDEKFAVTRLKQWSKLLGRTYKESFDFFQKIKRNRTYSEMILALDSEFPETLSWAAETESSGFLNTTILPSKATNSKLVQRENQSQVFSL